MKKGEFFQVVGVVLVIVASISTLFSWLLATVLGILGAVSSFIGSQLSETSVAETLRNIFSDIRESRIRKDPEWTPYKKVVSNGFPWLGKPMQVTIQLELRCSDNTIPLAARVAASEDGAYQNTVSGTTGVVQQLIIEESTYYVSVSSPKIEWTAGVLGWRDDRGR